MTTLSLYEIGAEFRRLEAALVESGGENTPEVEAAFEALGHLEAGKVDAYRAVIVDFEGFADQCRQEIDILTTKATVADRAVSRLKERLAMYMTSKGVAELRGERFKAALQRNGGKPKVTLLVDPTALPTGLQRITVAGDADRIRAMRDGAGDVVVDGVAVARVEPVGQHVRFR